MQKRGSPQDNIKVGKHVIAPLLLPVLLIPGAWGAGHYEVVGRGDGWVPTTFVPPSLLIYCAGLSLVYGMFCLWLAKQNEKPADFLATFFVSIFATGPFFVGIGAIALAAVAMSLNGWLDPSGPQTHQAIIQKSELFRGKNCRYYIVHAQDWRDPKTQVRLNVNLNLSDVPKGTKLNVTTRRGFFGYEWVTDIQQ